MHDFESGIVDRDQRLGPVDFCGNLVLCIEHSCCFSHKPFNTFHICLNAERVRIDGYVPDEYFVDCRTVIDRTKPVSLLHMVVDGNLDRVFHTRYKTVGFFETIECVVIGEKYEDPAVIGIGKIHRSIHTSWSVVRSHPS